MLSSEDHVAVGDDNDKPLAFSFINPLQFEGDVKYLDFCSKRELDFGVFLPFSLQLSLLCWPGHGLIAIRPFIPRTTFSQCVHSC